MSAFLSVNLSGCLARSHHFIVVGSDKTPLKRSLICRTCSEDTGKSAYAAYGEPLQSWGQWMTQRRAERFTEAVYTAEESE